VLRRAVAAEVAVTEIVGQDEDEVRRPPGGGMRGTAASLSPGLMAFDWA